MKSTRDDIFDLSLADAPAVAGLSYWSEQTGISERELRRLIDDGLLVATQARRGVKGSTVRIPKGAIATLLRGMRK